MATVTDIKKILIAPLDWGLGHATRCIPVIKEFQKAGCTIFIAACEQQKQLMQKEFPNLYFIDIPAYNIHYSKQKRWLPLKILQQIPKITFSIRKEHNWLQKKIDELEIDLVVSDNRFGLYSQKVPCVFITHQLQIKAPYKWLENIIRKKNYQFINRFTECWIPDFAEPQNIAGNLSHPKILPQVALKYIGILSRFAALPATEIKYQFLALVSGPEPQRSVLENKILTIAEKLPGNILLLRGKPSTSEVITAPANCTILNHLPGEELLQAYTASNFVIARSGYTTVMEIMSLQKKAILIPTPGQTEQEYLAEKLMQQQRCYTFCQEEDFLSHINKAQQFNYSFPAIGAGKLEEAVNSILRRI